jgi:SAM-dependent methyltransferase
MPITLLHSITFLAAFLLFQIELIVAKALLPVYGGSYAVWGACLVFFQAFLLLGYWFVHWAVQKSGPCRYRTIQLILVLVPLLVFPGRMLHVGTESGSLFLAGDVFLRLVITIGPVFFVLSTMSVALQVWLSSSSLKERVNPYTLYATSNIGSLGALLTYPFLFEVLFDLPLQLQIWRISYAVLAAMNIALFFLVPFSAPASPSKAPASAEKATPLRDVWIWLLLSAAGVIMFMSVTSVMTFTIVPLPLLWIIPLSIYILAFILSFKPSPWCPAWIKKNIPFILAASGLLFLVIQNKGSSVVIELVLLCGALFLICLYCQNRLATRRPSSERELTKFYLMISLGGFLGGILTSWIMPIVSKSVIEYLVGLTCVVLAVWMISRDPDNAPLNFLAKVRTGSMAIVPLLLVFFWVTDLSGHYGCTYRHRNYYGIWEVKDMKGARLLIHGTTMHGMQFSSEQLRLEPSCMFSKTSPVGEILSSDKFNFKHMAVIGLGAGTLAVYTRPDQTMDYYELDPDVYAIAKKYFSYLDDAKGKIHFIFGDARQTLAKATDRKYDLLVVDAFGGDSIPFHLLTLEAIKLYKERLNPGGILLFHVSNRYIRLEPVLTHAAKVLDCFAGFRATSGLPYGTGSAWVVFTWDQAQAQKLVIDLRWYPLAYFMKEQHRLWTDGYSNILLLLNRSKLKESLLNFNISR